MARVNLFDQARRPTVAGLAGPTIGDQYRAGAPLPAWAEPVDFTEAELEGFYEKSLDTKLDREAIDLAVLGALRTVESHSNR